MIRPWYRSRLFWLGVPGLVFMLWLWLAKAGQSFSFGYTWVTSPRETTTLSIGTSDGSIFQGTSRTSYNISGPSRVGFHGSEVGLDPDHPVIYLPSRPFGIRRTSVAPNWFYGWTDAKEIREIWLAWWVVISAYTAAWLGAVAGWQRRKARLSRRAAAELPGS
jgi:hypothetical protein